MIRKDILLQFETWMQKLKNKLDSSKPIFKRLFYWYQIDIALKVPSY